MTEVILIPESTRIIQGHQWETYLARSVTSTAQYDRRPHPHREFLQIRRGVDNSSSSCVSIHELVIVCLHALDGE